MREMKDLVVGVVGLRFGATHLKGVIENGATVGMICDKDAARLAEIGEECQIPAEKRTTDLMDVVNNKEIEVVILATPDMLHKDHIVAFLNAGKHVLCEKPLALEQSHLNEIVAAVKAHPECKFMVGQICRFTPAFKMAKEIIESGRVGEIYFVESEYAHDYEAIFNDPTRQWRADPKRHGVIGGGCHAVDLLRWLVGGDPYDIHAYGTHKMLKQLPYDDSTLAIMKFPGGIMGKVFVSTGCKRGYTMRTLVYGTKGTLIFDNKSDTMTFFEVNPEDPNHKAEEKIIPVDINNHNAASEFKTFADHILNDTPVTTDVYEGAKTAAACITIVESSMKDGAVLTPDYNFGM